MLNKFFIASAIVLIASQGSFSQEPVVQCKNGVCSLVKSEKLSDEKIDEILDSLIAKHKKLKHFTADLKQVNTGGMWKRPDVSVGKIYVLLPDKVFIDMSENERQIIFDGKYFWLHDLGLDDVERWTPSAGKDKAGSTKKMDVAAFFLGTDVKTAKEFRKEFNITGVDQGNNYRFTLIPLNKDVAEKTALIEIELPYDGMLPSYVKTVGKSSGKRKPIVTEQTLSNLSTNLDNVKAPNKNLFYLKPTEDMTFRDMPDNREVSYEEIIKDIKELKGKE